MKAILFDLDGVLYTGDEAIEGAADVISWCIEQGIPYLFLTNTTSRPRSALVSKLDGLNIKSTESDIHTPVAAALQWLRHNRQRRIGLFVPDATCDEFGEFDRWREGSEPVVDSVIVGDLGEAWDFRTLNNAFRLLMQNAETTLLALGMTRYWRAADGLRLDAAPFVKALEHASGREAIVLGKPSKEFFSSALHKLGIKPDEAIMIGDDIKGDIEGAQSAGIRGVLVKTGKFQHADLDLGIRPFGVIESVRMLPAWWHSQH